MASKKLKKGQKGKKAKTSGEESSSFLVGRPVTESSRPSIAASAGEIDLACYTIAYRIDIHRIPLRDSSLHALTSARQL